MWQDKTKPFVHRDVLQCCSCHSETRRDCTALWPVQRRVKHEFLWDVLVLYHKWATGLGLEHLGLNLFTQTQLPFSWGRQLFSISTPALQWDAKLWLLVEGLRDMSCSAAGVHDNPNKAARSVACSAGLRASWTGHPLVWGEGRWAGMESCDSFRLRWCFLKALAHSFIFCQKGQALNMDTHKGFPAPTPIVREKIGILLATAWKYLRDTDAIKALFANGGWFVLWSCLPIWHPRSYKSVMLMSFCCCDTLKIT